MQNIFLIAHSVRLFENFPQEMIEIVKVKMNISELE